MKTDLVPSTVALASEANRLRSLTTFVCSSVAALLLLSGCSSATDAPPQEPGNAAVEAPAPAQDFKKSSEADAGTATASIDGREFSFTLTGCLVYQGAEAELSGPGGETGSATASYLDGGFMLLDDDLIGEFRINIGTDKPFDSTDEFLSFGATSGGDGFVVVEDGDGYLATGNAWNNQGTRLGTGTVHFACH